jgi:hypothetical protein
MTTKATRLRAPRSRWPRLGAFFFFWLLSFPQGRAGDLSYVEQDRRGGEEKHAFPWPHAATQSVAERFPPPPGFRPIAVKNRGFGHWLRALPVKPGRPPVMLYNGRPKRNQEAHVAVIDIDVGARDLQQCADAVMRLRAEYLRSIGREDLICFRTAAGARARWSEWQDGYRPSRANPRKWEKKASPSAGYRTFRNYLARVFGAANSASILRQMRRVDDPRAIEHGDVYIEGAGKRRYGHAVIIIDVAEDQRGERTFLLAQSYMPAQEIHILKNPQDARSPWYEPSADGAITTPEWVFGPGSLYRFINEGC